MPINTHEPTPNTSNIAAEVIRLAIKLCSTFSVPPASNARNSAIASSCDLVTNAVIASLVFCMRAMAAAESPVSLPNIIRVAEVAAE